MKSKAQSRIHSIPKSSGLTKLVRGAASKRKHTIARQAVLDRGIRVRLFAILKKKVQKEMMRLNSKSLFFGQAQWKH